VIENKKKVISDKISICLARVPSELVPREGLELAVPRLGLTRLLQILLVKTQLLGRLLSLLLELQIHLLVNQRLLEVFLVQPPQQGDFLEQQTLQQLPPSEEGHLDRQILLSELHLLLSQLVRDLEPLQPPSQVVCLVEPPQHNLEDCLEPLNQLNLSLLEQPILLVELPILVEPLHLVPQLSLKMELVTLSSTLPPGLTP